MYLCMVDTLSANAHRVQKRATLPGAGVEVPTSH